MQSKHKKKRRNRFLSHHFYTTVQCEWHGSMSAEHCVNALRWKTIEKRSSHSTRAFGLSLCRRQRTKFCGIWILFAFEQTHSGFDLIWR